MEAEPADWREGKQSPPRIQKEIEEPVVGQRFGKRARRSTNKGATSTKAGKEKREVVLAPPVDAQGLSL